MLLRIEDHAGLRDLVESEINISLTGCLQCSKCGGSCSRAEEFDLTPRQIIEHLLDGQDRKLLDCRTIWLCGKNCSGCSVICPSAIPLNTIMDILRREAQQKDIEPKMNIPSLVYHKYDHCAKHSGRGEKVEGFDSGGSEFPG